MKNFFQFLKEVTSPAEQARRLNLTGDGHGGWYDNQGEFVAKTEGGKLKFYNKRQRVGQKDSPQTEKEKNIASPGYNDPAPETASTASTGTSSTRTCTATGRTSRDGSGRIPEYSKNKRNNHNCFW